MKRLRDSSATRRSRRALLGSIVQVSFASAAWAQSSAGAPAPVPQVSAPSDEFAPDEERRMLSRPLDEGRAMVKPGTGFSWQSEDGDFSFAPRLRAQFLYQFDDGEDAAAAQSIQIRRARLQFKGNLYGKANEYKVELAISPGDLNQDDGAPPATSVLLDWYLDFALLDELTLRVGQYKIPHNRQRVVSSGDLEMVDRSIVNAEFNLDRDLGLDLRSEDFLGLDALRYYLGVYAGEGRNTRGSYDFGMLYLARVEFLPLGMFDDYQEGDFERLGSPKLSLGIGAAHIRNARADRGILGSAPSDGGTTDFNSFTADAVFRYSGFSATTEWMLRDGDREFGGDGPPEGPRDGFGGMLQLSYLLPRTRWQVAGRAGFIRPRGESSILGEGEELGAGLNYYFAQHPFKLQADYFLLRDGDDAAAHRARLQLQASF